MKRQIALAMLALTVAATPAGAVTGTLQFWENSRGAPGVTAQFPNGTAQQADIDFDANSAEGGGLLYGATEIEIRPTGSVVFTGFTCMLANCLVNFPADHSFIKVSDGDPNEKHGIYDLGTITFDAQQGDGSIQLVNCNYTGTDYIERQCRPFALVNLPEPSGSLMTTAGAALLFGPLRRRRG
jgi:hypothetical protein